MEKKFCTKCGTGMEEGVKFCTNCGAPTMSDNAVNEVNNARVQPMIEKLPPKKGKLKMFTGVIIAVCIIVGLFASGSNSTIQVKAEEVMGDYVRDQVSAEKKYKDKKVAISGKLITKNQFNNSQDYALLIAADDVNGKSYRIFVDVPKENVDVVNKIQKGDFVNIEGTCAGIVKQADTAMIAIQVEGEKINK